MQPFLTLNRISKRFPGVIALDDVSFDVRPGEVHAFMGENGAGKSTLMKVAAGLHRPDGGTIEVEGREVQLHGPSDATRLGIHTVFQELTVLENLDVGRNVLVGQEPTRAGGLFLDRSALYVRAQAVLDRLDIGLDARAPIAALSSGQRQMVEIARACAEEPRVLVLDEPTSSLGRHEEELLFALIDRLRKGGVGIVYITHRMSEVFRLSDRITVLRDGRHVVTGPTAEFTRDTLIRAMVGRAVEDRRHAAESRDLPVALRAAGLSRPPSVRGVDLTLHAGEVLGIAGLMGSGRTELARLIAGVDRPSSGSMTLFGRAFAPRTPASAIADGVCYVSEDRKLLGLVLSLSVADNIALPSLRRFSSHGLLSVASVRTLARDWMRRLGVRSASPDVRVDTLSGGNQQKVVLAKWLAVAPRVILLDEPTRGVDVGAKAEIHGLIRGLAADGAAVLVISSELPEVIAVSDRILVMAQGRVAGIVDAARATEEALLDLAFLEEPDTTAA
ncbi:MAG: sugar ABC transporter ATP-binding protein [Inquilinaceae bacterium]